MAAEWFYQAEGRDVGPVEPAELWLLAGRGVIMPATLVRKGASGSWTPAGGVRGLFEQGDSPRPIEPPPLPSAVVAAPADTSPEEPDRIHPLTWVAIIAGSGFVLLLLWAMVFRDGSAPQQAGEVDEAVETAAELTSDKGQEASTKSLAPSQLFKLITPSVVWVDNQDASGKPVAFGSGFLVSRDGRVATNLHVVQGAHSAAIRLPDGTSMPVRSVVGVDRENDLVVLDIDGTEHRCIPLAPELPEVGTRVYAVGNPKGKANTLSEGIISGLTQEGTVQFIQTTAAISPGSSGGPLLSADGSVVGIITASLRGSQNLNLAIPAKVLKRLLEKPQQPLSLTQLNVVLGDEKYWQTAIDDDPKALATIWAAIRSRKLTEALKSLADVPSTRRGFGYWMASGHVHFMLENLKAARSDFSKAVTTDPRDTEALLRLAVTCLLSDVRLGSDNNWNTSRVLCKRILDVDPDNVHAYCMLGIMSESTDESIGLLKTASTLDPKSFSAQYGLAVNLMAKQRSGEAAEALKAALELEKHARYRFIADEPRRKESLIKLSQRGSFRVGLKIALAQALCDDGQYERALGVYKELLSSEPNNPVLLWGICYTYRLWRGDFKHPDAVHWEKRAQEKDKHDNILESAAMRHLWLERYLPDVVDVGMFQ